MNRRIISKFLSRRFCSQQNPTSEPVQGSEQKPQKIKFHPSELFPFKFRHEKYSLFAGFSEEELYGIRYGYKHSPPIEREIKKDNMMFLIVLVGMVFYILNTRDVSFKLDDSFGKYMNHDMNNIRPALGSSKE